jgi:cytochrome c-type biogenesis protein CcmH/NrfF
MDPVKSNQLIEAMKSRIVEVLQSKIQMLIQESLTEDQITDIVSEVFGKPPNEERKGKRANP